MGELTHFNEQGRARMVDVTEKPVTHRRAVAAGEIHIAPETMAHIKNGTLKKGDVLVIAGKGRCDCSYWGDHRSICAAMMGAEAVVIDGAFRDAEGCEKTGFPVFAKGLTCRTAAKSGQGTIQSEVSCGGILVRSGDLIVGDRNGVVVIPPEDAEELWSWL